MLSISVLTLNYSTTVTIEYFSRKTVDLLYNKPIPVSSGISTGYEPTNVGDIMNKGVELDLNGIILRGKD